MSKACTEVWLMWLMWLMWICVNIRIMWILMWISELLKLFLCTKKITNYQKCRFKVSVIYGIVMNQRSIYVWIETFLDLASKHCQIKQKIKLYVEHKVWLNYTIISKSYRYLFTIFDFKFATYCFYIVTDAYKISFTFLQI